MQMHRGCCGLRTGCPRRCRSHATGALVIERRYLAAAASHLPQADCPKQASQPAHRRQAVHQLRVQRFEELGEQVGAGPQRRVVTAKHEAQEGLPLGKALQRLAQQEGQEGELELACGDDVNEGGRRNLQVGGGAVCRLEVAQCAGWSGIAWVGCCHGGRRLHSGQQCSPAGAVTR